MKQLSVRKAWTPEKEGIGQGEYEWAKEETEVLLKTEKEDE